MLTSSRILELRARRSALAAREAPRIPWDKFVREVFKPESGEHLAIIGPTGRGKTLLQKTVLPQYPFVVAFATKPQDITMERLITDHGYVRLTQWRSINPIDHPRRVIWPEANRLDSIGKQRDVFKDALNQIFLEKGKPKEHPVGWAVAIDELWYVANVLGLSTEIKVFLLQGRSLGHSLVIATQRPSKVPLEVYDQSTHLFFFRENDRVNLDRMSAIQARDSAVVRAVVSELEDHQVLYINTVTGHMCRTRVPIGMKWVKEVSPT